MKSMRPDINLFGFGKSGGGGSESIYDIPEDINTRLGVVDYGAIDIRAIKLRHADLTFDLEKGKWYMDFPFGIGLFGVEAVVKTIKKVNMQTWSQELVAADDIEINFNQASNRIYFTFDDEGSYGTSDYIYFQGIIKWCMS